MDTRDFLRRIKKRHGLTSDYQVHQLMGWTTQRVSDYVRGRRELSDEACVEVAEALDLPAGRGGAYVIVEIGVARAYKRVQEAPPRSAARAKRARVWKACKEAAKILKPGAAASIVLLSLVLAEKGVEADQAFAVLHSIHYAQYRPPWRKPPLGGRSGGLKGTPPGRGHRRRRPTRVPKKSPQPIEQ